MAIAACKMQQKTCIFCWGELWKENKLLVSFWSRHTFVSQRSNVRCRKVNENRSALWFGFSSFWFLFSSFFFLLSHLFWSRFIRSFVRAVWFVWMKCFKRFCCILRPSSSSTMNLFARQRFYFNSFAARLRSNILPNCRAKPASGLPLVVLFIIIIMCYCYCLCLESLSQLFYTSSLCSYHLLFSFFSEIVRAAPLLYVAVHNFILYSSVQFHQISLVLLSWRMFSYWFVR